MGKIMTHFNGLQSDTWALPSRGVSISRTNHRAGVLIQYTYLCETDGCFAVAFSQDSELHARQQVDGHQCPQLDGSRGLIPSGKTLVQKMWDEADDALDAYKEGKKFKGMDPAALPSYIRGIAEVLTFCTVPCYKVTEDVLRELNRRWKMREGEIPFAPTPSYTYNPHLDVARSKAMTSEVKEVKPKSTRASINKVAKPVAPKIVELTSEQRSIIRRSYHEGILDAQQIADMFQITVERVVFIAGDKDAVSKQPVTVTFAPLF